ncbi:endo-1,4-beta-xylanase [Lachnospiraceae bacterium MD1]|uniref:Beta-xylanase n=1 Tax=Variimorphobacter saccharofermentans TaxID=2755051 RepID=A0A839K3K3_9FIRM|nr:sugar-binding protein [Variimorphobacter saccharofermentans]MBB2183261.1 endo-1,4-beta-xylanase [Variimorphobacter saccharofermentans]
MMKSKFVKRIITMLAVISMIFLDLTGSGIQIVNAATTKDNPVLQEATYRYILVGKSYDFNIKNKPSKASYQWKSSNKEVAKVNNKGVVKAVAPGSASITCKITSGKKAITLKAKVYVKKPSKNPATKIAVSNKIQSMAVGESFDLNCTFTPTDASDFVNWTSSDTTIARVDANGVVTALKNGKVTIKATTINKSRKDKVTIRVSPEVTVSNQEQLDQALTAGKASSINISSDTDATFKIPQGDYSGQELIVNAPKAVIHNYGVFRKITIRAISDQGWNEFAKGNTLHVGVSSKITIEENADSTITVEKSNINIGMTINGNSSIDVSKPCVISFDGKTKEQPKLNIETTGVRINAGIALQINASYQAVLNFETEAAARSKITVKDTDAIPKVEGNYRVNVEVDGKIQSIGSDSPSTSGGQGGSPNPPATAKPTPTTGPAPTTEPTPTEEPTPTIEPTPTLPAEEEIEVDEKGFTPEGRIVAKYGTPKIDGEIDDIWTNAIQIQPPHTNNAAVQATATFKLLWDDNALYVLAQVNDPNMTQEPRQAHEKDSIEIFLDENNDKTSSYGSDDLQFRVNYENVQSAGNGDLSRFYTATKTGDGSYIVEARIEFQSIAVNNKICGMELQVNDGIGTSRAGTITVFDTTDSAWSRTSVFGEVILTGKKDGDVPGLNPYKLIKLISSAEKMQVTAALFTENLKAAKDVVTKDTSTQMDIDTAYDTLNRVITFVNAVTKAANMDLSVYQTESAAAVKKVVEEAEQLLAKGNTSADQMDEAIAAIDKAVAELKIIGLDQNGNMVAKFGSPVIDGDIDPVWDKVNFVPATASGSGSTDTTAKYKALWDDKALYVLADVTDNALDVTSGTVYNRDCVEIFLDEGNNAIENIFDLDDTHYRISCENSLSADRGSLDRLYTAVSKKKNAEGKVIGYIVEARISLQNPARSNNIYGFELQLNDAKGGNRTGTLNVFDKTSTAYASPTRFGKVVLSEKEAGDVIGFNKYDLLKLVSIANDIELVRYTDDTASKVIELVAQADATIATGDQTQVDALYASLNQAIRDLVHKDIKDIDPAISKIKEFRRIPAEYLTAAPYDDTAKGTVVRDYYDTYEYSDNGERGNAVQKNMLVYLPAGYNPDDKNTRYNVLYLIHGTSEDQNTVFGDDNPNVTTVMKKVLDMMIANGELDPMIIVTPYYRGMESGRLQYEIVNEIMPYIATKYNTYAASGSKDDLKAVRNHYAVGGFSQGSSCTFTIMRNCFDYFKYYLPISGGPGNTDFTSVVKGYAMNDYYVFASTGTDDIAYGGMVNAIPAMADYKDSEGNPIFNYNADLSQGNLYLLLLPDGTHTWQCVNQYLYNILPDVFFAEKGAVDPDIVTDENGFTADGRIVGKYGTPKIDGEIDEVWNNAIEIKPPHINNAAVQATATFKVLWDDNALYVLARVKDPNMTVAPSQVHEKDSIEIFLDENNDKTSSYGSDDLQFRVNYENAQSLGSGDLSRFYTATKTGDQEYLVEARIALQNVATNNTIYGIELQVNDGIGTSRAGTITLFDTTDSAWRNPAVFGEIILTGKKAGDTPGLNPYKLMALIDTARNTDTTGFTKGVGALTVRIEAANTAVISATTQAELDAAFNALNDVITFIGVIQKYAGLNLDFINNGEEIKKAVAAAEDILAKADATNDQMKQASAELDAAIAGIGSYSLKDVYADKFLIGAAVHLNGLADTNYTQNLLSQYNSITAENDMKPEALLDRVATVSGGAIKCDFTKMDEYCNFAVAHGLKMRGHTFVWHSQTPTWFFKEGFEDNGAYVDVATMDIRLQQFMDEVFGHIKENYPDLFYAYDICNEVVSSMSMGSNHWKTVYGDYSYVTKAFEFARKASEGTGIKLYYNDYNEYDEGKAEKIIELLADAKAAGNVDGIGMQSHVNIYYPPMDQYRDTIEKFAAAGYEVQITELDIATSIDGNGPAPDSAMAAKQAQIYKDLFQIYIDYKDIISSVTLWGINDQHSWRGSQDPLIFDREYKEKDSYWNIISVGLAKE